MGLKRRVDPPRSFTPEQAQQWYKLQEAIEAELGVAGLSSTLFVDQVVGEDSTAQRGSLVFKYATIQAALDAALEGDTIWVTPGEYTEDLVWPDTNNLTLRGTSRTSTSITNLTAVDTLTIAPTVALTLATIVDLAIWNDGANLGVNVDGTANPGMFTQTFRMSDCIMKGDVTFTSINAYDIRDVEGNDADLEFISCGPGEILNSHWQSIVDGYAIAAANPPTSGPGHLVASGVTTGILSVTGLAMVRFSKDTFITGIVGDLVDTATARGFIEAAGITGAVSVVDVGTSLNRAAANIRSAELLDQVGPHVAGNLCDMDLRGSLFNQASLAVAGDGAIDRSVWVQTIPAGNSPATPVLWANAGGPVPYVSAPDSVHTESDVIGELPIAVVAKTAASVTCQKTLDAAAHIVTAFKDYVA